MEALLEPLGFEVVHAEHGAAALQLLRTSPLDLAFLDLEMPVLDGRPSGSWSRLRERSRSSAAQDPAVPAQP